MAGLSIMDFSNTALWCDNSMGDRNPIFPIADFLHKFLIAYDFVGRNASVFNSTDRSTLDNWFWHMANFFVWEPDHGLDGVFVDRNGGNYTANSSCSGAVIAWVGGPSIYNYNMHYSNRRSECYALGSDIALFLAQFSYSPPSFRHYSTPSVLKDKIKAVFKEYIMFGLTPLGAFGDSDRRDDLLPDLGLGYTGSVLGNLGLIADGFARIGDSSLFTYNTANGLCGSEGTINDGGSRVGQNKDYLFFMQAYCNYFADVYARYHPSNDSPTDNNRIDGRNPRNGSSWHTIRDTWAAMGNLYYQDNNVKTGYMRTRSGTVAYPATPQSGDTYEGPSTCMAGWLFQYGQLEGVVDPYP